VSRRILTLAAIAGICAAHMGRPQAVQLTMRPAAAAQIAAAIGSDADARTVMSMFLTETFPPSDRRRTEFLLRDQIRDEWLPKLQGVELVPLSERRCHRTIDDVRDFPCALSAKAIGRRRPRVPPGKVHGICVRHRLCVS